MPNKDEEARQLAEAHYRVEQGITHIIDTFLHKRFRRNGAYSWLLQLLESDAAIDYSTAEGDSVQHQIL